MKLNLQIAKLVLVAILLINYSCEKDNEEPIEIGQESKIQKISLDNFSSKVNQNDAFNTLKNHFDVNLTTFSNNLTSRVDETSNLILLTDEIIRIKQDDIDFYTFKVLSNTSAIAFYNLIVQVNQQQDIIKSELLKYVPSASWISDTSASFSGTVELIENTVFSLDNIFSRRSSRCVRDVTVESVCTGGWLPVPNPPGIECQGYTEMLVIHWEACPASIDTDDSGGSGFGIGDGNSDGGGENDDDDGGQGTPTVPTRPCEGNSGITGSDGNCFESTTEQKNCAELKKLLTPKDPQNHHPEIDDQDPDNKNKNIRDALLNIGNEIVPTFENGYALVNKGDFRQPPQGHGPLAEDLVASSDNHVYPPKEGIVFGIIHTHPKNAVDALGQPEYEDPMFSSDDIASLVIMKSNYSTNLSQLTNSGTEIFTIILAVEVFGVQYTYALKIEDPIKFQNLTNLVNNKKKFKNFNKKLKNAYKDLTKQPLPNISAQAYEKQFLKFMAGYDFGLALFEMDKSNPTNIKWKKLSLSANGNQVEKTEPCN